MSMLEIDSLEVRYGAITALSGVSIHVSSREIVALIGPNGAGKTSLLMTIAGAVRGASGSIRYKGKEIKALSAERIVKGGIALVPENRDVFTKLSVRENLLIGTSARARNENIADDLEYVHSLFPKLAERRNQPAGLLSGGEQQMLAIGRALMSKPDLLLLDEPSLGLAPIVVDAVYETIERLRKEGRTVLLVEQNAERATSICDRAYLLSAGVIQGSGDPQKILSAGDIDAAYFGLTQNNDAQ